MGMGSLGMGCCCEPQDPTCPADCITCPAYDPAETSWTEGFPGVDFSADWYISRNLSHGDIAWTVENNRARAGPKFVGPHDMGWLARPVVFDCTDHNWIVASCRVWWTGVESFQLDVCSFVSNGAGFAHFSTFGATTNQHFYDYVDGDGVTQSVPITAVGAATPGDKLTHRLELKHIDDVGFNARYYFNVEVFLNNVPVFDDISTDCFTGFRISPQDAVTQDWFNGTENFMEQGPRLCRAQLGFGSGLIRSGPNWFEIDDVIWESSDTQPPLP